MNKEKYIVTGKLVSFDFGSLYPAASNGRIYNEDIYKKALYEYNQRLKRENRIKKLNELLNE